MTLLSDIRAYLARYLAIEPDYAATCALWVVMTYLWDQLDAIPYLCITSDTKRSGKTRLAELLMFLARTPRTLPAPTPAGIFRSVGKRKPTLFIDEAESLSGEAAGAMRSVLNVGYRRGQSVVRIEQGRARSFSAYCPKCIILIGDPYDTLRDRSIIVRMVRAEAPTRFVHAIAQDEGAALAVRIAEAAKGQGEAIVAAYQSSGYLPWLQDREEEIWQSLFAICRILAPAEVPELERISADLAIDKTADRTKYRESGDAEDAAELSEYGRRLASDLLAVLGERDAIHTRVALDELRAMPTGPWRKWRGDGLDARTMAALLRDQRITPRLVRLRVNGKVSSEGVSRGYRKADIERALGR
jgi:Protein of unknown function (DUF3631)